MSFTKLLTPSSVAVVGASTSPDKVGYAVLNNIVTGNFPGPVYPVNPKAEEILGTKCYKSLADIPGEIDCAVIVIKRDQVIPTLRECIGKGIRAVIIITAGFAETGEEGKKLQTEIAQMARQNGVTLLGPNCLGLINPVHRFNASFGQAMDEPGHIAFVSQSGALITAIQDIATNNRIGFSLLASMGNKAALDEVQLLENLRHDDNTKVITAYLEDISHGQDFMRVAERVGKQKPLVILKSGRTQAGARAASSHTGSLAGADAAYDSAFERSGVIRADSIEHLFDIVNGACLSAAARGRPHRDRYQCRRAGHHDVRCAGNGRPQLQKSTTMPAQSFRRFFRRPRRCITRSTFWATPTAKPTARQ